MYQVKKAEKGHITEFDLELFTKSAKETEMRRLFHKMLNEELFTYYFQPIVSAADGSIYAYEALDARKSPGTYSSGSDPAAGSRGRVPA